MIYKNIYSKFYYKNIQGGEINVTKYPFHTGLRVTKIINGRVVNDIHCKNVFEAIRTVRQLLKDGQA